MGPGGRDPVLVSRSCKRHHLWLFPRGVERSTKTLPPGLGDARTPGHIGRTNDRLTVNARRFNGEYFFGYTWDREGETQFSFRAHANGITFGFSQEEWNAVQKLFRRAWEMPELQATWDELTMEYGDL